MANQTNGVGVGTDYKKTLNLPQTDFPMRANLPQREPDVLARWEEMDLYGTLLRESAGRPTFLLHDGPPYANGHVHLGTALNKVIKDVIVRSKAMAGFHTPFVPGWDCHGMPIEHQVTRELGPKLREMSQVEVRRLCRAYAERFVDTQRQEFRRLGVLGDWAHPYLTMAPEYEASIVRVFRELVEGGYIYRGKRPVHWCATCGTALAEAEVEYAPHTSPSIYVRFPFAGSLEERRRLAIEVEEGHRLVGATGGLFIVIWTTTPWTLPANLGVCLNPHLDYVAVPVDDTYCIVAERLADAFLSSIGRPEVRERIRVDLSALDGKDAFRHPFLDRPSRLLFGPHVTADTGTGCVHTAPGHGYEDFSVGQQYGLPVLTPVDDAGRFTAEAADYEGRVVFDVNEAIVERLRENGSLLRVDRLQHSYPHCWRCKKALIFRATEQWFLRVDHDGLRERAVSAIDGAKWIPGWGIDRIRNMVEARPDWCLSRQRAWGVPIPAFRCLGCQEFAFGPEVIRHVEKVFEDRGSDAWYELPAEELLPPGHRCGCGSADFEKDRNILDVWFDSGCSHVAVLEGRDDLGSPADLYVEAVDQHRGWFQVSLLTSVATRGVAPYRAVLTHGLILDETAKKMSKSLGNVIAPEEIIKTHGAEILRLLFASVDYTADICFSKNLLTPLLESYRRIRNTCRFLLGNLHDFDPARDRVALGDLPEIDRWILGRTAAFAERTGRAYGDYQFHLVVQALVNFCAVDLSALYLDIVKDRLYTEAPTSPGRRAAQTVLHDILDVLVRVLAPILSFTAEEIWKAMPGSGRADSVLLAGFRTDLPRDEGLDARWERLLQLRTAITKALEESRQKGDIGHSLEARLVVQPRGEWAEAVAGVDLAALCIVSQVEMRDDLTDADNSPLLEMLRVRVERAAGAKCERCWNYAESVGTDTEHPALCHRCLPVVRQLAS